MQISTENSRRPRQARRRRSWITTQRYQRPQRIKADRFLKPILRLFRREIKKGYSPYNPRKREYGYSLEQLRQSTQNYILARFKMPLNFYKEHENLILHLVHGGKQVVRQQVKLPGCNECILECFGSKPNQANISMMFDNDMVNLLWFSKSKTGKQAFRDCKGLKTLLAKRSPAELEAIKSFMLRSVGYNIFPLT